MVQKKFNLLIKFYNFLKIKQNLEILTFVKNNENLLKSVIFCYYC